MANADDAELRCPKHDERIEVRSKYKYCLRCERVCYCSETCQKADWEFHKLICPQLAKLDDDARDEQAPICNELLILAVVTLAIIFWVNGPLWFFGFSIFFLAFFSVWYYHVSMDINKAVLVALLAIIGWCLGP